MRVLKEPGETNLADKFTKQLPIKGGKAYSIRFKTAMVNMSEIKSDTDYRR